MKLQEVMQATKEYGRYSYENRNSPGLRGGHYEFKDSSNREIVTKNFLSRSSSIPKDLLLIDADEILLIRYIKKSPNEEWSRCDSGYTVTKWSPKTNDDVELKDVPETDQSLRSWFIGASIIQLIIVILVIWLFFPSPDINAIRDDFIVDIRSLFVDDEGKNIIEDLNEDFKHFADKQQDGKDKALKELFEITSKRDQLLRTVSQLEETNADLKKQVTEFDKKLAQKESNAKELKRKLTKLQQTYEILKGEKQFSDERFQRIHGQLDDMRYQRDDKRQQVEKLTTENQMLEGNLEKFEEQLNVTKKEKDELQDKINKMNQIKTSIWCRINSLMIDEDFQYSRDSSN